MQGIITSVNISVIFLINSGGFKLYLNRLNELEALPHPTEVKAFVAMCLLLSLQAIFRSHFAVVILNFRIAGMVHVGKFTS